MKKNRFWHRILCFLVIACIGVICLKNFLPQEPSEVRTLRDQEVLQTDDNYQEYYFNLLAEEEKRIYRQMLSGIQNRENEFYLTSADETMISKVYHALLKDHPELFWVHNREEVYTTSYKGADYCRFSPGYTYTDQEVAEITDAIQTAVNEVNAEITQETSAYDKVRTIYTYLIDHAEYEASEDDQNIAGIFWKKKAVCAGYARAMQYLLEKFGVPCIYVEGSAKDSEEGHAWNIVEIDGKQYYVDVTNGDQPSFLEGGAVSLEEHKTVIYDYLCPFPQEYEQVYTASEEFPVPACTATDLNFYVLNQACFDTYDTQQIYDFCCMRLDNGAAVVRFKFTSQEAFDSACQQWIQDGYIQNLAGYYLEMYGLSTVEYHYGILDNLKTMYFMF